MRIVLNPSASRDAYTAREQVVVSRSLALAAHREISRWPGYAPTPLRRLDDLAASLRIGRLDYKDESGRLGQGSFKTLGGAYAVTLKLASLASPEAVTLCCATDGNHGRSVAFAAQRHGCACIVFMHEHAPAEKESAIIGLGARVIRVKGTYDDSVRVARESATAQGWMLVADTSDDPLDQTTLHVLQGYGVMVLEVIEQFAGPPPTHVFVQAGVGGLAAAVMGVLTDVYGADRPRFVVVEPEAAACLLESVLLGRPAKVGGDLRTQMAMLSTGEASPVAWPILQRRGDAFVAVDDAAAVAAVDTLEGADHIPLSVGVSGAAGLAGLMEVLKSPESAAMLGLGADSRVLVFGTEQGAAGFRDSAAGRSA